MKKKRQVRQKQTQKLFLEVTECCRYCERQCCPKRQIQEVVDAFCQSWAEWLMCFPATGLYFLMRVNTVQPVFTHDWLWLRCDHAAFAAIVDKTSHYRFYAYNINLTDCWVPPKHFSMGVHVFLSFPGILIHWIAWFELSFVQLLHQLKLLHPAPPFICPIWLKTT